MFSVIDPKQRNRRKKLRILCLWSTTLVLIFLPGITKANAGKKTDPIPCDNNFGRQYGIGKKCLTSTGHRFTLMGSTNSGKIVALLDDHSGLIWSSIIDSLYYGHDSKAPGLESRPKIYRYAYALEVNDQLDIIRETACESGPGVQARAGVTGRDFGMPSFDEIQGAMERGLPEALAYREEAVWAKDFDTQEFRDRHSWTNTHFALKPDELGIHGESKYAPTFWLGKMQPRPGMYIRNGGIGFIGVICVGREKDTGY